MIDKIAFGAKTLSEWSVSMVWRLLLNQVIFLHYLFLDLCYQEKEKWRKWEFKLELEQRKKKMQLKQKGSFFQMLLSLTISHQGATIGQRDLDSYSKLVAY